jgi:hypothetical protein
MSQINYDNLPKNDGEVRTLILETIVGVRDGSVDVAQGSAMASLFKELNSSMLVSINAAKLSLQMEESGRKFIKTLSMGRQEIAGSAE